MNRSFAFTLVTALTLCATQLCQAAEKKNPEANRLAREGAEAAKSQDWDKAVDLLKKATAMDRKYADELSAVYQQRGYAAAKMKIQDYDKALADYSELIKQKPNEIKYLNYRAYIYELKNDLQNSQIDNEKILKADPNNQDAKARKQRLEQKIAERVTVTPPPRSPTPSPTHSPARKKKP